MTDEQFDTDVLVVGAGASGIPAAIGAARQGAKVVLIEEDPVIGGAMTDYGVDYICGGPRTGVVREAETALKASCRLTEDGGTFFLPFSFQKVYGRLLRAEANVTILAGAKAVGVLLEDAKGRPAAGGVTVQAGVGESLNVRSRVTIDATGTGAVAVAAGCESMYGCESAGDFGEPHAPAARNPKVQDCTWMYFSHQIRSGRPFDMMKLEHVELGVQVDGMGWFHHDPERALRLGRRIHLHWGCAVECADTRSAVELARTQAEAFDVMQRDLAMLREDGYAVYLAPRIGVREAGRIVGEHVVTENDLRSGKLPDDTVAIGNYGLDIWGADGEIPAEELTVPYFGIPFRALVPKDVDGLLLAGKIISGTHLAMSAYRVMPIVGSVGQAAGIAAALCAASGWRPRASDPQEIRNALRTSAQGVALSAEEVESQRQQRH